MNVRLSLLVALVLILGLGAVACGGGDEKPAGTKAPDQPTQPAQADGDATKGQETYARACAGCHGASGEGVEGLGKPWTNSNFIQGSSNEELLAFIKKGRSSSDPANTTGVDMPPKGGNPALTDVDLLDLIAFMRTLQ